MLRQKLFYTALIASIFVGSVGASALEDEARAFGSPVRVSGAEYGATEYGTAEEAKAMLDRAIAAVKADKPGAIAMFNHNDSRFRDRDLFVFCFNGQDGKFTAHEAMVAHDVRTLRDKTGRPFGEQMYLNAKEGQIDTVAYLSPVGGSTEQASKRAYVTRIADQVCGVSFYRFNGPGEHPPE